MPDVKSLSASCDNALDNWDSSNGYAKEPVRPLQIDSESLVGLSCSSTNSTCSIGPVKLAVNERMSKPNDTYLHLTVIGSVFEVRVTASVSFSDCPVSFLLREGPDGFSRCTCGAQSDRRIFWCDPLEQGRMYIAAGLYLATQESSNEIQLITCPPGYCGCKRNSHFGPGCEFDITKAKSIQCENNRSGMLCGACADGFVSGTSLNGECKKKGKCDDGLWASNVVPVFVACIGVYYILYFRRFRFYNCLRGFLYFSFAVTLVLDHNDAYLIKLKKSEDFMDLVTHGIIRLSLFYGPGSSCYYPSKSALQVVAYNFITPGIALFLLPFAHIFATTLENSPRRYSWWARTFLKFKKPERTTLVILFFILQSILFTSARLLLQCVTIFGDYKFFWDGNKSCWKDEHATLAGFSALFFFPIVLLDILMWYFSKVKECWPVPLHWIEKINCALTEDLDIGARCWWSWDLLRRVILLSIYAPINFCPWWLKRTLGLIFHLLCVCIHIRVWPYLPSSGKGRFDRRRELEKGDTHTFSVLPNYITDLLHFEKTEEFPAANVSEISLLIILCIISWLGSIPVEGEVPDIAEGRTKVLEIFVFAVVLFGAVLFIYRLFKPNDGQQIKIPTPEDHDGQTNDVDVNNHDTTEQEDWRIGSAQRYYTFTNQHD